MAPDIGGSRIVAVDLADDAAWAEVWRVFSVCEAFDSPGQPPWLEPELRAMRTTTSSEDQQGLVAYDESGTLVGLALMQLPLLDNRDTAWIDIFVDPQRRRCGLGTALLEAVATSICAQGRHTLLSGYDRDLPDGVAPGGSFCDARGFSLVQVNQRRDLLLPLESAALAAIRADCLRYAEGYELAAWQDRCPDEYVDQRAQLHARLALDAPTGEAELEPEVWDAQRVREGEGQVADMGRHTWVVAAIHSASGELAGITTISGHPDAPDQAWQWDTVVLPSHRGHRLGLLLKVANVEQVAEQRPRTRRITTWNASTNLHMIAVNEALGASLVREQVEVQKHLV